MITKPPSEMIAALLQDFGGNLPNQRISGKKVARKSVSSAVQIPYALTEISAFRKVMFIPANGVAFLTWSIDMSHRGVSAGSPTYDPPAASGGSGGMPLGTYYPIGISGQIAYRRAVTEAELTGPFSFLSSSIAAGQLADRKHHYQTINGARVPMTLEGGFFYEFSIALSSHTDAGSMNGTNGAAELTTGGGINFLQVEYEPGAVLEP